MTNCDHVGAKRMPISPTLSPSFVLADEVGQEHELKLARRVADKINFQRDNVRRETRSGGR